MMRRPDPRAMAMLGLLVVAACGNARPAAATDSTGAETVGVSVRPGTVYIERGAEGQQHVNFDFLVDNRTGRDVYLLRVELWVLDPDGRVVRRDFVDDFSRKSLEIEPRRALKPGAPTLVYNPFPVFALSLPIGTLRYELTFETKNGKVRYGAQADVVPVAYEAKTALVLPLRGRVLVREGHDYQSHHRRTDFTEERFRKIGWTSNFQRYAYDFVVVDERGSLHRAGAKDAGGLGSTLPLEQHLSFGHPVHATGAGRVVDAHDGARDGAGIDVAELERRPAALGGNYVVIDHGNGEFSWFGHLKQGSVRVKAGQAVAQGEVIAEVGSSGDSMAPHLHYELRTGPGITGVEGLPSYFGGFRRTPGGDLVMRGQLDTGDIVEHP